MTEGNATSRGWWTCASTEYSSWLLGRYVLRPLCHWKFKIIDPVSSNGCNPNLASYWPVFPSAWGFLPADGNAFPYPADRCAHHCGLCLVDCRCAASSLCPDKQSDHLPSVVPQRRQVDKIAVGSAKAPRSC